MSQPPQHLADPGEIRALLDTVVGVDSLSERLDHLSAALLGRPYLAFSLVGGPSEPEQLVTRLDGFDCVTYVETVWALACSDTSADYPQRLQRLRYHGAQCTWLNRNHYMSRWIQRNVAAGQAWPILLDQEVETGEIRNLSCLPGYPVQRWPVRFVPSGAVSALQGVAQMGDLVGFMSNKPDLDTFHVGMLAPSRDAPLAVRHAGRSLGKVVHQDLAEFLEVNDVPGMLLARPLEAP